MQTIETDFFQFIARFNLLKKQWFSPQARPKYDPETNEELPTAISQENLVTQFKNMGLHPPRGRKEAPMFLDPSLQQGFDNWLSGYEKQQGVKLFG